MKKRFWMLCIAMTLSLVLLLTGCGEGKGAEDTGEDGKVGGSKTTTHSATATTTTSSSAGTSSTSSMGGEMMDDAKNFVEDIMPGGNATNPNMTNR